jgi:hypothetical protein
MIGLADALAVPLTVEFNGHTWKFASPLNLEVMALFERYLQDRAWETALAAPPAARSAVLESTGRDIAMGQYDYYSEAFNKALHSEKHTRHLCKIMINVADPKFEHTAEEFEKLLAARGKQVIAWLIRELQRGGGGGDNSDPTAAGGVGAQN